MRSIRRASLFNGALYQRGRNGSWALCESRSPRNTKGLKAQFASAKRLAIYDATRDAVDLRGNR